MEKRAVMKGCDVPCKGIAGDCSHCLIVLEPEHRRHDKRRLTGLREWGVLRLMCVFQLCTKKSSYGLTAMKVLSNGRPPPSDSPQENR